MNPLVLGGGIVAALLFRRRAGTVDTVEGRVEDYRVASVGRNGSQLIPVVDGTLDPNSSRLLPHGNGYEGLDPRTVQGEIDRQASYRGRRAVVGDLTTRSRPTNASIIAETIYRGVNPEVYPALAAPPSRRGNNYLYAMTQTKKNVLRAQTIAAKIGGDVGNDLRATAIQANRSSRDFARIGDLVAVGQVNRALLHAIAVAVGGGRSWPNVPSLVVH